MEASTAGKRENGGKEGWIKYLGAFGLLDFTMLGPFSLCARFETYEKFISLIFKFFSGRGKPRILNQRLRGHDCTYLVRTVGMCVRISTVRRAEQDTSHIFRIQEFLTWRRRPYISLKILEPPPRTALMSSTLFKSPIQSRYCHLNWEIEIYLNHAQVKFFLRKLQH
jgi:hypothetical protein